MDIYIYRRVSNGIRMNKDMQHTPTHKDDHGSMTSYVIGFMLSLNFTIIPYYLVVNKIVEGTALLVTILIFAVLQMFVQIFFFLHLGRGPKPLYNVVFFFGTAGIIVVVVVASLFIMSNLYRNMLPGEVVLKQAQKENIAQVGGEETGACKENKQNHIITISAGTLSPAYVKAKRCDTLTFLNRDKINREIGFGNHPEDISYGGEDKVLLDDGRPETITLNEVGYFVFHDHNDSSLVGSFYVTE
jgi:cytochrome o ubiquinol oxidase operon protein cyoD